MADPERTNQAPGIIIAQPVTSEQLLGGPVAKHRDNDAGCIDLSDIPIQFAGHADADTGAMTFIGVPLKPLTGDDLNRLLYTIAPAKSFGLDTADIIMDWTAISEDTPEGERLRSLHEELVGEDAWERVMSERGALLTHIHMGAGRRGHQKPIVPVLQWTVTADGQRFWGHAVQYDLLSKSVADQLDIRAAVADRGGMYHPMTGLAVLALFSPSVTETWPDYVEGQLMGPTQVLGQVVEHEPQLLESPYITAVERYVRAAT